MAMDGAATHRGAAVLRNAPEGQPSVTTVDKFAFVVGVEYVIWNSFFDNHFFRSSRLLRFYTGVNASRKLYGEPAKFHQPSHPEPYVWETFAQFGDRAEALARGLAGALGLSQGDRLGLWSVNRLDWALSDAACGLSGIVSVPLYDTLGTLRRSTGMHPPYAVQVPMRSST
jgi:hypothetical protein